MQSVPYTDTYTSHLALCKIPQYSMDTSGCGCSMRHSCESLSPHRDAVCWAAWCGWTLAYWDPPSSEPLCRRGAQGRSGEKPSQCWWPGQHVLPLRATIRSVAAAQDSFQRWWRRRLSTFAHTLGSVGSCAGQVERVKHVEMERQN